ncbi:MAG: Flp pilus assembly complex ATPase component TadA [Candidatus Omnitrophica bacterium]|nr:Flp pilus assembly complex ATPase component TadA [Candidatus Omnitrophota bacterium]
MSERQSKIIVVFGTKGGTGKTLLATNLAAATATSVGVPVALLELDPQAVGDLAKMVNLRPNYSVVDVLALLKDPAALRGKQFQDLLTAHPSDIHVLPCVRHPSQLRDLDPTGLKELLTRLRASYDYIIIDAGRTFTDTLVAAIEEANLLLLVLTPDILSMFQARWAVEQLERLLVPMKMVKIVLNRADSRGGVTTPEVKSALPCDVIAQLPSDGRAAGVSVNQGVPLMISFPRSRLAAEIRRLVGTLAEHPEWSVTRQPAAGRPAAAAGIVEARSLWNSRIAASHEAIVSTPLDDEMILLKRRVHEGLVERLDLKRVEMAALADQQQAKALRSRAEAVVSELLIDQLGGHAASRSDRFQLIREIVDEALGLGPLEALLADPEITDILVNNKDQIYVERHGRLELTGKRFTSDNQLLTIIERIVSPLGRRIDEANPMVDARLPDGSRVNAIIPPLALKGPSLSIRKFARTRYTVNDLIKFGSLTPAMAEFLRACVVTRKNVIISGGTGSGKTTLLNIVSSYIPAGERIVTIEDAAELRLNQEHLVVLESRPPNVEGKGAITIRELFRNSLRMRPDRIIIGECRGAEALDMLQAMNTGHDGSLTTIHANSPRDAVARLDSLVLMSNVDLPIRAIREQIASAIDVVIQTVRYADGSRKVTSIAEITGLINGTEVGLEEIFIFRQTGTAADGAVLGEFVVTGHVPTFLEELRVKGVQLSDETFRPSVIA